MTPVRGDDEKQTRECERDTRDDRPAVPNLNAGTCAAASQTPANRMSRNPISARRTPVMRQSEGVHGRHSCCPAAPVSIRGGAAATPQLPHRESPGVRAAIGQQRWQVIVSVIVRPALELPRGLHGA